MLLFDACADCALLTSAVRIIFFCSFVSGDEPSRLRSNSIGTRLEVTALPAPDATPPEMALSYMRNTK
jgi:hypothetical protein